MVQILPFKALRYSNTNNLSNLTAPPYDVIDDELQQTLYDKDPANCIRLILGKTFAEDTETENVYTRASQFLTDWQTDGTLQAEESPSLYAYSQTFNGVTRKGLIALLKIEEYDTKQVLPHEKTIAKYIADRRDLGKTCLANLSQIFLLYSDPTKLVETKLFNETNDWVFSTDTDNVAHKMAAISDNNLITEVQSLFKTKNTLIADGHHRYQTALTIKREAREAYKAKHGNEPEDGQLLTDYWMVFLSNIDDDGLLVYPTHRLLKEWPEGWSQEKLTEALKAEFEAVDASLFDSDPTTFKTVFTDGTTLTLKPKAENPYTTAVHPELLKLDVTHIDKVIIEGLFKQTAQDMKQNKTLHFDRSDENTQNLIHSGKMVCGFLTHAPSVHQVKTICEAGQLMPQKSTYFYPKILSGLAFYSYAPFNNTVNSNDFALKGIVDTAITADKHFFETEFPVTAS